MIKIDDRSKVQHITARMQGIVSWSDVWVDYQYSLDNQLPIIQDTPYGLITHSADLSLPRVKKMCESIGAEDAQLYVAFCREYPSLGPHRDTMDVLFVQSIGQTTWEIEDESYYLSTGDAIYVPKGKEHKVISHGARVGVSMEFTDGN